MTSKLPDKPSELIRLALTDLAACEKDPRVSIDMGQWHRPIVIPRNSPFRGCMVCLAGAVLRQTLKYPDDEFWSPEEDYSLDAQKLVALNAFRIGANFKGFTLLGLDPDMIPMRLHSVEVPDYRTSSYGFKVILGKLANDFEALGL